MSKQILVFSSAVAFGAIVAVSGMLALGFRRHPGQNDGPADVSGDRKKDARSQTPEPRQIPQPSPPSVNAMPAGGWTILPAEAAKTFEIMGYSRAKEWCYDRAQPTRWLVRVFGPMPKSQDSRDVPPHERPMTPLRPEWKEVMVSAELAQAVVELGDVSGVHGNHFWPLYVAFHGNDYLTSRDRMLTNTLLRYWTKDGVPTDVANWLLEHEALDPPGFAVWMAIEMSKIPVPESTLRQAIEKDLEKNKPKPNGARAMPIVVGSAAMICRDQYPESGWWKQIPEVMEALAYHDRRKSGGK